jgi:putative transposase
VIVAYIDVYKVQFGVEQICRVLTEHAITISPSTYYARCASPVTAAELEDAYAAHEVFCLFHDQRGLYGVLKLWHSLRRRGREIGRDQVVRLMGICGVAGIVRGKRRTVIEWVPLAMTSPNCSLPSRWNTCGSHSRAKSVMSLRVT